MRFHTLLWSIIASVGLAATLGGGYLIMSGPFFGGAVASPVSVMASLVGFIVGMVALAFGGSKLARSRVGY